ncbi:MAG: hypothetical protein PHC92_10435 [Syntrophomonadaceae bacterium]|nr:hypothetical protein [Syntrophomonadaceae bacterium]MDD3350566.1 hypothetical protein [Eubacteriales bacterium]
MKRAAIVILCLSMILSLLAACGASEKKETVSEGNAKEKSEALGLVVDTVSSVHETFDVAEVLPDYVDADLLTGEDRLIKVDVNVPQVDASVPGAEEINQKIADFDPYMMLVVEGLNAGDLSVLVNGDLLGSLTMDYDVYSYNQAEALVVESKKYLFHAGGGNSFLIVYYDSESKKIITAAEYLEKCGITQESLLERCAEENYAPSYPGDTVVKTIDDVKFAVDNSGTLMLYTELAD